MKKIMFIALCLSAMTWYKAQAQEKTMPTDSIRKDNMRTPMDDMKMPMDNMKTPMDNIPMKMDTTPPNMPMKTMSMPNKDARPDRAYDRTIDKTVNRMNRDTPPRGSMNGTMQQ